MKLAKNVLAVIAATLILAGCGGGESTEFVPSEPKPTQPARIKLAETNTVETPRQKQCYSRAVEIKRLDKLPKKLQGISPPPPYCLVVVSCETGILVPIDVRGGGAGTLPHLQVFVDRGGFFVSDDNTAYLLGGDTILGITGGQEFVGISGKCPNSDPFDTAD